MARMKQSGSSTPSRVLNAGLAGLQAYQQASANQEGSVAPPSYMPQQSPLWSSNPVDPSDPVTAEGITADPFEAVLSRILTDALRPK